jgi:hypothetical protein
MSTAQRLNLKGYNGIQIQILVTYTLHLAICFARFFNPMYYWYVWSLVMIRLLGLLL